ncbi:hypothetical protein [Nocardia stercoris]|uniref:Uncharacterized protein n=1 Tax=Nocardia stercoris TaxID=2483361 RepID=A0A3M2LF66_9NOCA|nr:hypothetical protein [Nocardia stercoris]RMI35460.1 hypothetical protein EBN03_04165 [Nocardia stercoris]
MAPNNTDALKVDPHIYYDAAATLITLTGQIGTLAGALTAGMPTYDGMGGNYTAAAGWNTACTKLTNDLHDAILAYSGALAHFSDILNIAGYNWDTAEYNANISPNKGTAPPQPALNTATPLADNSFPAIHQTTGDNGTGLTMRGSPGGDTWDAAPNARAGALKSAASAWNTFANDVQLEMASIELGQAHDAFNAVKAPEVADIQEALAALQGGVEGIKNSAGVLADALHSHSDNLGSCRQALMNAAASAFPKHQGQVTTSQDDTSVTVNVAGTIISDDLSHAFDTFKNTANGTDLFYYLSQATDSKGFRAALTGPDVLANLPKLKALKELPILVESGNADDNKKLIGELDTIATWETPQASLTALDLSKLDQYGPLVKSWAMLAVKYGNEAHVDPAMVLAMVLQEGGSLHTGYPKDGVQLWQALENPESFHPDPDAPGRAALSDMARVTGNALGYSKHGDTIFGQQYPFQYDNVGNSLGLTNIKKDPFNDVKNAYKDQFAGKDWSDLAGNDDLDIKTTAYNLKLLNEGAASQANDEIKASQPLDQFLGSGYNAGGTLQHSLEVADGKAHFTDDTSNGNNETAHGQASVRLVALANQILKGSGAYQ